MEITHAQSLWLLEESLSPHPRWHTLPKGSPVYLLDSSWVQSFRSHFQSPQLSPLTPDICPINNSPLRTLLDTCNDWTEPNIPASITVVPESVYTKIFQYLVVDPKDEIKAWVIWGQSFSIRLVAQQFTVITYLINRRDVEMGSITFEGNKPIHALWDSVYQFHPSLLNMSKGSVKMWTMKWNWSQDQILCQIHSKAKIRTYADELGDEMKNVEMLRILSTLHVIIRVKSSIRRQLLSTVLPTKLTTHSPDMSVGLKNLGNTCFLNSILQSLAHLPPLSIFYYKRLTDPSLPRKPLNQRFSELVRDIYGQEGGSVIMPSQLKATLGQFLLMYTDSLQHDADELLTSMLSRLISEDLRDASVSPSPPVVSTTKDIFQACEDQYQDCCKSFLAEMFTGLYRDILTCENCEHTKTMFPQFRSLPLNLTPSRLFTIHLVDFLPMVLQKTFRIQVEGSLEQDVTLADMWNAIEQRTGEKNLVFGTMKNRLFFGPLDMTTVPRDQTVLAFRYPQKETQLNVPVMFDVYVSGYEGWKPVGTRLRVMSGDTAIDVIPNMFVEHLRVAANEYFENSSIIKRMIGVKISENHESDMVNSLEVCIEVICDGASQHLSLANIRATFGIETLSQLLSIISRKNNPRFQCYFTILFPIVSEALQHFQEDTKITVKHYSENQLTVTLGQLIEYNRRVELIEDLLQCDHCHQASRMTLQHRVAKFPAVLVLPILRGVVIEGEMKKCKMEVCFPASSLDLSEFEEVAWYNSPIYDLMAVVKHKGRGVRHGHYIAYVRHPLTTQWYYCSDSKCKPVPEEEVLASKEAYMLIYIRR